MHGIPWNMVAMRISGDVGGVTIYTDKVMRKVVFPIAPPDKPPSPLQSTRRRRFQLAQAAWKQLTREEKADLEESTRMLGIPLTGQNLYLSVALTGDESPANAISRQTGITLPPIPYVQ